MACKEEINGVSNSLTECPVPTDEIIVVRVNSVGPAVKHIFRITWARLKNCLIAPASVHFTVDDPANVDTADITFPLGGGTILFYSGLIGRRAVIILVNNLPLPQRNVQPDYGTPNFTSGEITRPDSFKSGDYVEVFPL